MVHCTYNSKNKEEKQVVGFLVAGYSGLVSSHKSRGTSNRADPCFKIRYIGTKRKGAIQLWYRYVNIQYIDILQHID